jgi:hypothetical protein
LLPAGAVAGWDLHPLESAAFARRTPEADIGDNSQIDMIAFCSKISSARKTYGTTDAGYFVS